MMIGCLDAIFLEPLLNRIGTTTFPYTMEGSKSILIFWESSDAKWKGGRAGRGKLERDRYVLYHRSVTLSAATSTSRVTQCDVIM